MSDGFTIQVKAGDAALTRFHNMIADLGDYKARVVMARALNRTGGPMLTQVRRTLAGQTSADFAGIRKVVVAEKAWSGGRGGQGKLQFVIRATGGHIALRYFQPFEAPFGGMATVWGSTQFFKSAFMRGGQWPRRVPLGGKLATGGGKELWVRSGPYDRMKKAAPVRRMYGPNLAKELVKGEAAEVFKAGTFKLMKAVEHELEYEMAKALKK